MAQRATVELSTFMGEYNKVEALKHNLLKVWKGKLCGLYSMEEERLYIPCEFQEIRGHLDGHFRVRQGNKWGVYSNHYWTWKSGDLVVPTKYDEIKSMSSLWIVRSGEKWGIYSAELKREIIPPKYEMIESYREFGHFRFKKKDKWGIIHGDGHLVFPPEYDRIERLKESLYLIEKDGKSGLCSARKNEVIIPLEFDKIEPVGKNLYKVCKASKWGVYRYAINHTTHKGTSELVIPLEYDSLELIGDTLFKAMKDGKTSMVPTTGR